jgi:two-component system, NarL family, sensor kinase
MDTEIILVVCAAVFIFIVLCFLFRFIWLYQKRTVAFNSEKEKMQNYFQQELLRTQLEIQEQTFRTISQEIHDNIGQILSLAKLNLNTIDLQKEAQAAEKINAARDLVSKTIHDLRDLSKTLNTETIAALVFLNAVETELNLLQKTGTLQTSFELSGIPVRLDAQKQLILFRIVQEALHNVIKHARASAIRVKAAFVQEQFELLIVDDGCGFAKNTMPVFGSGLRNMQSRSKLIGADWQVESADGEGTTIRIILPI